MSFYRFQNKQMIILLPRVLFSASNLSDALRSKVNQLHEQLRQLEGEKYDWEEKLRRQDVEVSNGFIQLIDMKLFFLRGFAISIIEQGEMRFCLPRCVNGIEICNISQQFFCTLVLLLSDCSWLEFAHYKHSLPVIYKIYMDVKIVCIFLIRTIFCRAHRLLK